MREYEYQAERAAVAGWREPLSPLMLIQEQVPSRWAAVVGAVMCCRTGRPVSHRTTWALLARWPTPESLASAPAWELVDALARTGLVARRFHTLVSLSRAWGQEALSLAPGVGTYVVQSDRVFGLGDLSSLPADRELFSFVVWARSRDRDGLPWRTPFTVEV